MGRPRLGCGSGYGHIVPSIIIVDPEPGGGQPAGGPPPGRVVKRGRVCEGVWAGGGRMTWMAFFDQGKGKGGGGGSLDLGEQLGDGPVPPCRR